MRWWEYSDPGASQEPSKSIDTEAALRAMGLAHHLPKFQAEAITHEMLQDLTETELEVDLGVVEPAERARFREGVRMG
eukprot:COSAG04_NODE_325_length_16785_cov_23.851792_16_plen_78_part_00